MVFYLFFSIFIKLEEDFVLELVIGDDSDVVIFKLIFFDLFFDEFLEVFGFFVLEKEEEV